MKIYVATVGEYSDYHIEAVFLNKEKAQLWLAAHEVRDAEIEEYDTQDENIQGDISSIRYLYFFWFIREGSGDWEIFTKHCDAQTLRRHVCEVKFEEYRNRLDANITIALDDKDNFKKAEKIARDYLYKALAAREGIA